MEKIIVSVLVLTIIAGLFISCSRSGKLVPLTDEAGNYSEEAFAKNLASYKYGGLKLFANGKTKYKIIYPVGSEKILTDAVSDLAARLAGMLYEAERSTAPVRQNLRVTRWCYDVNVTYNVPMLAKTQIFVWSE